LFKREDFTATFGDLTSEPLSEGILGWDAKQKGVHALVLLPPFEP
jgi:hypothetical protein